MAIFLCVVTHLQNGCGRWMPGGSGAALSGVKEGLRAAEKKAHAATARASRRARFRKKAALSDVRVADQKRDSHTE